MSCPRYYTRVNCTCVGGEGVVFSGENLVVGNPQYYPSATYGERGIVRIRRRLPLGPRHSTSLRHCGGCRGLGPLDNERRGSEHLRQLPLELEPEPGCVALGVLFVHLSLGRHRRDEVEVVVHGHRHLCSGILLFVGSGMDVGIGRNVVRHTSPNVMSIHSTGRFTVSSLC